MWLWMTVTPCAPEQLTQSWDSGELYQKNVWIWRAVCFPQVLSIPKRNYMCYINISWKLLWIFFSPLKSHIIFLVLCFTALYMLPFLVTQSIFPSVLLLSYFIQLCVLKLSAFYKLQSWLFGKAGAIEGPSWQSCSGAEHDACQMKAQQPEPASRMGTVRQCRYCSLPLITERTQFMNSLLRIRLSSYFSICHDTSCWNTVNCYSNMKFMAKSSNLRSLPIPSVWLCTIASGLQWNWNRNSRICFYYKVSLQVISATWVYLNSGSIFGIATLCHKYLCFYTPV